MTEDDLELLTLLLALPEYWDLSVHHYAYLLGARVGTQGILHARQVLAQCSSVLSP